MLLDIVSYIELMASIKWPRMIVALSFIFLCSKFVSSISMDLINDKNFQEKKKNKQTWVSFEYADFSFYIFSLAIQHNSCLHWVWLVLTLHVSQRRLKVYRCISHIWKYHAILYWVLEHPPILWSTGIPRTTLHEHGRTTM